MRVKQKKMELNNEIVSCLTVFIIIIIILPLVTSCVKLKARRLNVGLFMLPTRASHVYNLEPNFC